MTTNQRDVSTAADPLENDELSLVDLFTALGEQKTFWLLSAAFLILLCSVLIFQKPRLYTSSTLILPPQQQQNSAAAALSQLGALAGLAGAGAGVKTPDEMYVSMLKTQRLQDILVDKLDLMARYDEQFRSDARAILSDRVRITADKKTGLILIEADDKDSHFAASLANSHFDELSKFVSTVAITEAQQRKVFFERQVAAERSALTLAEEKFRRAQSESGFVVSEALAANGVQAGIELRSKIASREISLKVLRKFATNENNEIVRLSAELAELKSQLGRIEQGQGALKYDSLSGSAAATAFRDYKIRQAALETLVKQYEVARIDEARDGPLLQQLDKAVPADKPSKPKRALLLLGAIAFGVLGGGALAYLRWWLKNINTSNRQWNRLIRAWRGQ